MDPNETLADFRRAVAEARRADTFVDENEALLDAVTAAADLFHWLAKGGFPPDWNASPDWAGPHR